MARSFSALPRYWAACSALVSMDGLPRGRMIRPHRKRNEALQIKGQVE
jgi:hypothetical protein